MKTILIFTLTAFISLSSFAQSSYAEAIEMGDKAFRKEDFRSAINYYFAAEAFDPAKKVIVKDKINKVFNRIERLKKEAIDAKVEAQNQRQIAIIEKEKADASNFKNQKLIDAFYFYEDKYALAVKKINGEKKYGFINKEAETVIEYKYEKAEQFDETGFAKVKKEKKAEGRRINNTTVIEDYLIDTEGNEYRVAYKPEDVTKDIKALYLKGDDYAKAGFPLDILVYTHLEIIIIEKRKYSFSNIIWNGIPKEIEYFKNLKVLRFVGFDIVSLPDEIGKLERLERLELSNSDLKELPNTIGSLKSLKVLNLNFNSKLEKLPQEIGQLKNLTYLNLNYTQIRFLPQEIFGLTKLEYLSSVRSPIDMQLKEISQEIKYLTNLKHLDLSYNGLPFIDEIMKLEQLEVLGFSGNRIKKLPNSIGNIRNLKELYIGGSYTVGSNSLDKLPASFVNLKKLEILDLSFNNFNNFPSQIFEIKSLRELNFMGVFKKKSINYYSEKWKNLDKLRVLNIQLIFDSRSLPIDVEKLKKLLPTDCKVLTGLDDE